LYFLGLSVIQQRRFSEEAKYYRIIAELKNAFAGRETLQLVFYKIDVKPQATDLQRLSRIQIYLLRR